MSVSAIYPPTSTISSSAREPRLRHLTNPSTAAGAYDDINPNSPAKAMKIALSLQPKPSASMFSAPHHLHLPVGHEERRAGEVGHVTGKLGVVQLQARRPAEVALRVAEQQHIARRALLHACDVHHVHFALFLGHRATHALHPLTERVRRVRGEDRDRVHALGREEAAVVRAEVAWQVLRRAHWAEGGRHGHHHHLLAAEDIRGGYAGDLPILV
eukprot:scaffold7376_cov250-Pinguiococcus_pyrenoidosus.AAC.8